MSGERISFSEFVAAFAEIVVARRVHLIDRSQHKPLVDLLSDATDAAANDRPQDVKRMLGEASARSKQ